jgi:hypothetical protein
VPWWYLAANKMMSPFLTQRTKSKFIFASPAKSAETLFRFCTQKPLRINAFGILDLPSLICSCIAHLNADISHQSKSLSNSEVSSRRMILSSPPQTPLPSSLSNLHRKKPLRFLSPRLVLVYVPNYLEQSLDALIADTDYFPIYEICNLCRIPRLDGSSGCLDGR